MRLNEKNVASFAVCSSPVDKEGYLQKKGDLHKDFQRRWFVLKGNLLFYFLKKQDKEPQGVIVLEACSVQVSVHGRYCFEISFDGAGTRLYILGADNDAEMQLWMKAISHASYEYLKSIVDELQRRVNVLSSSSMPQKEAASMEVMNVGRVAAGTTSTVSRGPTREATVTLRELNNPIAPQIRKSQSTKIKKGILVDVSEDEAPPIPMKKKSMTLHGNRTPAVSENPTYTDTLIGHHIGTDSVDGAKAVHQASSQHTHPSPFSSPLVPNVPIENTYKPLSPPSTLDRTTVLQPLPAHSTEESTSDKSSSMSPPSSTHHHNGAVERVGGASTSTEPSSHPQVPRKLAAPMDPGKSFIEMHESFTEAMKTLNAQRVNDAAAANKPPS